MAKGWYILQVFSNYENKVKNSIERLIQTAEISDEVLETHIPVEEVFEVKGGKKKAVKKKFLPGYLLMEIDMPEDTVGWKSLLSRLLSIHGVTGFLGSVDKNTKPKPIPSEEARAILQKMGELKSPEIVVTKVDFSLGEQVKITVCFSELCRCHRGYSP